MKFFSALFGSKSSEDSAVSAIADVKAARKAAKNAIESHIEVEGIKGAIKERTQREAVKAVATIDALLV